MANPFFEPIIGSSFDALAGQRQGWAQFNRGVEEANLERLQRAQERQNQYLATVAQMRDAAQQRDINNQFAADESARRDILTQGEAGERARQFNVNAALAQTQQENEVRKYQFAQDEQKRQENVAKDQVANAADFMLPDVQDTGPKFEASQQAAQDALDAVTTKRASLERDLQGKKIVFNRLTKEFDYAPRMQNPMAAIPPDIAAEITGANDKLAQANAEYLTAQREHQANSARWSELQSQAGKLGLLIGKRGDKYVINSPMHNRTWGESQTATASPSLDAGVSAWEETSPGSGWLKPAAAGNIKAIRPITATESPAVDAGTAVTNPSQYFSAHEDPAATNAPALTFQGPPAPPLPTDQYIRQTSTTPDASVSRAWRRALSDSGGNMNLARRRLRAGWYSGQPLPPPVIRDPSMAPAVTNYPPSPFFGGFVTP